MCLFVKSCVDFILSPQLKITVYLKIGPFVISVEIYGLITKNPLLFYILLLHILPYLQ